MKFTNKNVSQNTEKSKYSFSWKELDELRENLRVYKAAIAEWKKEVR